MPPEIPGPFESHLTLAATASLEALRAFAAQQGVKVTHIVLAGGVSPSQPMLTRHARGTLQTELAALEALAAACAAAGFVVTRTKIEVESDHAAAPATAEEATDPATYFEHHLKLLLPREADLSPLLAIAQAHHAHLSRNALRTRADGRQERFVTQRRHHATRDQASAALAELRRALAGYSVLEVEQEFVIYDSNLALDAGWIGLPPQEVRP
jgi:hypothetical protein